MDKQQVDDFLRRVTAWAQGCPDVLAVALLGSYARGRARPDSDLDLVLVCSEPEHYLTDARWVLEFGKVRGLRREDYGKVTSLRVWYGNGLEVEYGIAGEDWADAPLDEGTRQVIADGMLVLYERNKLLSRLQSAADAR